MEGVGANLSGGTPDSKVVVESSLVCNHQVHALLVDAIYRLPPLPPTSNAIAAVWTLLLRLQGYQTCVDARMLAPGLANVVLVQHLVLGVFAHLLGHFDGLLEKHLFLGRTLLLRLQGYQTCAGWCRSVGTRASKQCVAAAFRARDVW